MTAFTLGLLGTAAQVCTATFPVQQDRIHIWHFCATLLFISNYSQSLCQSPHLSLMYRIRCRNIMMSETNQVSIGKEGIFIGGR